MAGWSWSPFYQAESPLKFWNSWFCRFASLFASFCGTFRIFRNLHLCLRRQHCSAGKAPALSRNVAMESQSSFSYGYLHGLYRGVCGFQYYSKCSVFIWHRRIRARLPLILKAIRILVRRWRRHLIKLDSAAWSSAGPPESCWDFYCLSVLNQFY